MIWGAAVSVVMGPGRDREKAEGEAVRGPGHSAGVPRTRQGRRLAGLLAVVVMAACTGPPSVSSVRLAAGRPDAVLRGHVGAAASRPQPSAAAARACGPLSAFAPGASAEIMAGRLTISPWPAVTIDPHRDGDVDWSLDPFGQPTWFEAYQSGRWIEALIGRYLDGGPVHAATTTTASSPTRRRPCLVRGTPAPCPGPLTASPSAFSRSLPGPITTLTAAPQIIKPGSRLG